MRGRATTNPNSMAASEASSDDEDQPQSPRVEKTQHLEAPTAQKPRVVVGDADAKAEKRKSREVPTIL